MSKVSYILDILIEVKRLGTKIRIKISKPCYATTVLMNYLILQKGK